MSNEERFANTCQSFQAAIREIALACNKEPIKVYALWRKYCSQCEFSDQSPLLWEFAEWYAAELGKAATELQEIVRKHKL